MYYREVMAWKNELRMLKARLAELANISAPTENNLAEVKQIEARAKQLKNSIAMRCKQYGFTA